MIAPFFTISLLMFLFRLFEALFYWPADSKEWEIFFTGFRFDLLILSFVLIPILMMHTVLNRRHKWISRACRIYLLAVWSCISVLYFLNGFLFSTLQDRIWLQDWGLMTQHLGLAFQNQSGLDLVLLVAITALFFWLGQRSLLQINQIVLNFPRRTQSFILLLVLGLLARGSLGPDHLRRNDCDFKSSSWVRALCLNPIYTFTKLKNTEF